MRSRNVLSVKRKAFHNLTALFADRVQEWKGQSRTPQRDGNVVSSVYRMKDSGGKQSGFATAKLHHVTDYSDVQVLRERSCESKQAQKMILRE